MLSFTTPADRMPVKPAYSARFAFSAATSIRYPGGFSIPSGSGMIVMSR